MLNELKPGLLRPPTSTEAKPNADLTQNVWRGASCYESARRHDVDQSAWQRSTLAFWHRKRDIQTIRIDEGKGENGGEKVGKKVKESYFSFFFGGGGDEKVRQQERTKMIEKKILVVVSLDYILWPIF